MEIIARRELQEHRLPGRIIQKAVGKDARSRSSRMTMGFGRYSKENGPMEAHQHAEEICYVVGCCNAWVRFGVAKDELDQKTDLEPEMTLHIPELEWHVFEYAEDGFLDIIFFYGQVDHIRPEEISNDSG